MLEKEITILSSKGKVSPYFAVINIGDSSTFKKHLRNDLPSTVVNAVGGF